MLCWKWLKWYNATENYLCFGFRLDAHCSVHGRGNRNCSLQIQKDVCTPQYIIKGCCSSCLHAKNMSAVEIRSELCAVYGKNVMKNSMTWVSERTIPTEQSRLSAKLVPALADRGCYVVSVTDPYGRILSFLDRSRYVFFQVACTQEVEWTLFQTHYFSEMW
jgi:hypothetical protein